MVDEVWFMVSPQNPLKEQTTLLDDCLRYEMVCKAVEGMEGMCASDYEFRLPRPSYTWNTLQSLGCDYPERKFSLLIGGDNWVHFDRWFRGADIISLYPIIIYPRSDAPIDASSLPPNVQLLSTCLLDISSTEIRSAIRHGSDISSLVPPGIVDMAKRYYSQNSK